MLNDAGSSNPGLCDNLEGRYGVGGEGRFNREGTYLYLRLIHVAVWHKPTQHYIAAIFQLKINKLKKKDWSGGLG